MSSSGASHPPGADFSSRIAALAAVAIGALVMLGWIFGVETLQSVLPGLSTTKFNTAAGILLGGVALLSRHGIVGRACAALMVLLTGLTLSQYLTGADLRIDQLVVGDSSGASTAGFPGRMGISSAATLFLLGLAVLTLGYPAGRRRDLADGFALGAVAIAFTALVGYLFSVTRLTGIASATQMAIPTAAGCALLGVGVLLARPPGPIYAAFASRGPGGVLLRRFLPLVVFLIVTIAALLLAGERRGLLDPDIAMALLVIGGSLAIAACALWHAALLDRLDQDLRRDRARLMEQAALLDLAHVMIRDLSGRIRLWNTGSEKLYGWSRNEAVGRISHELLRAEFPRPLAEINRSLIRDGSWQGEEQHRHRDGHALTVASHWVLREEPAGEAVVLQVSNDVTDLKRAEAGLREARIQLDRRLASSPAVIYSASAVADGLSLTWVSENIVTLMGHSVAAALSPGWWLAQVHPDDRDGVLASLARASGQDDHSAEYRFRYGDGSYRWLHDDIRLVQGEPGRIPERIGAWLEVTERRRLEEQFRQAQKMEAVGRLAGGVAHDFNNLLTVILSYVELVREEMGEHGSAAEDLGQIQVAAESAARLTHQLLAFSRQQVLQPRVLDLNEVVTRSEKLVTRVLGEHIRVTTRLGPGLALVRADPDQLDQVILNLAVNARDAMPEGGRLTIETANAAFNRPFRQEHPPVQPGRYVMLSVSDTGVGMDEETRARAFEPFFTTKGSIGTGLGLSTVYGIVEQSGGHIGLRSEPGQGATFRIYLPAVEAPADAGPGREPPVERGGGETVLLVEDVRQVRDVTRAALERLGYRVIVAADGPTALALSAAHVEPIHLLLTDVVMPEMLGPEVAERLRRERPSLRVLYMSGYAEDAVLRRGVLAQGLFLPKPFRVGTLARKVREALDAPVPGS